MIKMTEVQKAYLLGRNGAFNGRTGTHLYAELKFRGDIAKFNDALNKVISIQPMLRARVHDLENFCIEETLNYRINLINTSSKASETKRHKREELSHKLYSSSDYPFFTIEALEENINTYTIFVSFDLLIADGMSLFQLLDQIKNYYAQPNYILSDMKENLNYIHSEYHKEKQTTKYEKAIKYWREELDTLPNAPTLLINEEKVNTSKFERLEHTLPKEYYKKLVDVANNLNVSLNSIFMTFYCATLQRWSENKDITINMTTFKRPRKKEYAKVIGDFTSTLLVKSSIDHTCNLSENARKIQKQLFKAFRYSSFEGIEVLREIGKNPEKSGLMPYIYTSMLFDFDDFNDFIKIDYWISQTPQAYLDCQLKLVNGDLHISWDYLVDIFDQVQIKNMFEHFIMHFDNMLNDLEETLIKVNSSKKNSTESIYQTYNNTHKKIIRNDENILDNYYDILNLFKNEVAYITKNESITFNDLNIQSEILKNKIIKLKNEKKLKKIRIAITGPKDIGSVIAMLATIKLKDSFCFVSPDIPNNRLEILKGITNYQIIINNGKIHPQSNIPSIPILDDELYTVFTSGTTGAPKGISINESAVLNTIFDIKQRTSLCADDVIFNISELTFDLSIFDLLVPLLFGCRTIICTRIEELKDYSAFYNQITLWNSTPGLMQVFLNHLTKPLQNLQSILISGDFIPKQLIENININTLNNQLKIFSLGGATEASIWSIFYPLHGFSDERIPYGYPLANQQLCILDSNDNLVEPYTAGEICIMGEGLANGYLNTNENERIFYSHGSLGRIYRTGDKGYLHGNGYIVILGRIKSELKINGYRIDLIEIENALKRITTITDVKVTTRKNSSNKSSLIAIYTTSNEQPMEVEKIRKSLKQHLPDYMIPTMFYRINTIPLTINGKVDNSKINEMIKKRAITQLTTEEKELLTLWRNVLEYGDDKTIAITSLETFFSIGGDSILLPELLYTINAVYGVAITIEDLLNHFTLSEQTTFLYQLKSTQKQTQGKGNRQLIQLSKGSTNKNIILVHAGSGEIGIYTALAKLIDSKYNVYAIKFNKKYTDISLREFEFTSLAVNYNSMLDEFNTIDFIGGWCIGGAIGFEIANLNPKVKNVLLINTLPPLSNEMPVFKNNLFDEKEFVTKNFNIDVSSVTTVEELWETVLKLLENNLELMPKLLSIIPPELTRLIPYFGQNNPRELIYYINLFRSFEHTRFTYTTKQVIQQPILYIGAKDEVVPGYKQWQERTFSKWLEQQVTGDHTTIFDEKNIYELAETLNSNLRIGEIDGVH